MESQQIRPIPGETGLALRLLGPLTVTRDAVAVPLPGSRKVLALLAYLALQPGPVARSRLCELLWDVANDPRGELRWCLTKLRGILNAPGRERIAATGDSIALDLGDCAVDALTLADAAETGIDAHDLDRLQALAALCRGPLLDGLEIERNPQFNTWLAGQRRRFLDIQAQILERLAVLLPPDRARPMLERWIEIAPADPRAQAALQAALAPEPAAPQRRASLAVMPLRDVEEIAGVPGGLAAGLTYDIITRLAKLRHFFVIAQGSVFALAEKNVGPEEAGRRLDVDYVATGTVRRRNGRVAVTVELIETRSARILWSETFERKIDDLFAVLDEIGDSIVSAIAAEIETVERNHAVLKPPASLNAWEAYHRGLWHMYRFTKAENGAARHFFEQAIRLDPTFSRAHAGLSFTHWQSAFQRWDDRGRESEAAYAAAGQSLLVDDRDPVAHWAMGRALWLRGRQDESLVELQSAVELSPNFALGHYALAFVHSQSGDPQAAIGASDHSRRLSPFDPMLFGMLSSRAMALVRLGRFEEAAEWALRGAARPNAHVIIQAIAVHCLGLAGRVEEARALVAAMHKTAPGFGTEDFLATFQFPADAVALFRQGAARIGLR